MPWTAMLLLAGAQAALAADPDPYHLVGATPCDAPVRAFLEIASSAQCEVIRWELRLAAPADTPQKFTATIDFGLDGKRLRRVVRSGTWTESHGIPERRSAAVWELTRGAHVLALWRVDAATLYLLDAGRRLLPGNGGFSYTLTVADSLTPRSATGPVPELSYQLTPLSAGPDVYGIFEGRTPCEIAKRIGLDAAPGCIKLKWRVTLFQSPELRLPVRYKLEGALFPEGPREGRITRLSGAPFDPGARLLALDPPPGKQSIYLMRGDENVLFMLDSAGRLATGDGQFSYVLSRKDPHLQGRREARD